MSNNKEKAPPPINLDEILDELGHFGFYQLYVVIAVCITTFFYALCCAQFVFNTLKTPHRCVVPECEKPPYKYETKETWAAWALPSEYVAEQCERKTPRAASCTAENFLNTTQKCTEWVYENNNTIYSEFNLACRQYMASTVGTVHNAGVFTTLFLTAIISDTFGRKVAYLATAMSASVMGIIRSFSVNYVMYVIFEYLEAALGSGVYSSGFVLAMEMIGVSRRVAIATIIASAFSVGQALAAVYAHFVRHWQTFTRSIYVPGLLFPLYYFIIEESVRWLLSKGRKKEALKIINKVARINKKKLTPETLNKLTKEIDDEKQIATSSKDDQKKEKPTKKKPLFMRVIRSRIIMSRVSVAVFWWMGQTFVFYGINYVSVYLGANRYVSYAAMGIAEIPGYFLCYLLLDKFGRKPVIMSSFISAGLCMYAVTFLPVVGKVIMCFCSKALISCAVNSIYIYTMELFPTEARQSLHNFCSMIGRFGSMSAPQAVLLSKAWEPLPFVVFGSVAVIAGSLVSITPETKNTRLPDTIAEAEAITQHRGNKTGKEKDVKDKQVGKDLNDTEKEEDKS